jgi:hypothetical protein
MGCVFIRHGSKHDWHNPRTKVSQPVPRHREIKEPLTKHIIKMLSDDESKNTRGQALNIEFLNYLLLLRICIWNLEPSASIAWMQRNKTKSSKIYSNDFILRFRRVSSKLLAQDDQHLTILSKRFPQLFSPCHTAGEPVSSWRRLTVPASSLSACASCRR